MSLATTGPLQCRRQDRERGSTGPSPTTTALGALLAHIAGGARAETFQPMNVNFGLFPPLEPSAGRPPRGRDRKKGYAYRAVADLDRWLVRRAAA